MHTFYLKYQKYISKNISNRTIAVSHYSVISKSDLGSFNMVMIYPDINCQKYFNNFGFTVYMDDRLPKNSLIFSTSEMLDWLLDDDKKVLDVDYPLIRVIYAVK